VLWLLARARKAGASRQTVHRQFFCPALLNADEWKSSWNGSRLQARLNKQFQKSDFLY
jgi:hypothetical protein